jgi:hypothetical protein
MQIASGVAFVIKEMTMQLTNLVFVDALFIFLVRKTETNRVMCLLVFELLARC